MTVCHFFAAAKLGRRSHKMRELICEATRTIQDSQTQQALHGLLSLQSPDSPSAGDLPTLLRAIGQSIATSSAQDAADALSSVQDTVQTPTRSAIAAAIQASTTRQQQDRNAVRTVTIGDGGVVSAVLGSDSGTSSGAQTVQFIMQMHDGGGMVDQTPVISGARSKKIKPKVERESVPTTQCWNEIAGNNIVTTKSFRIQPAPVSGGTSQPMLLIGGMVSPPKSSVPSVLEKTQSVSVSGGTAQPMPIQIIATSQGMIAIPQGYQVFGNVPSSASVKTPSVAGLVQPQSVKNILKSGQYALVGGSIAAAPVALPKNTAAAAHKRKLLFDKRLPASDSLIRAKLVKTDLPIAPATTRTSVESSPSAALVAVGSQEPVAGGLAIADGNRLAPGAILTDANGRSLSLGDLMTLMAKSGGSVGSLLPNQSFASPSQASSATSPVLHGPESTSKQQQHSIIRSAIAPSLLLQTTSGTCQAQSPSAAATATLTSRPVNTDGQLSEAGLMTTIHDGFEKSFWRVNQQSMILHAGGDAGAGLDHAGSDSNGKLDVSQ